MFRFWAILRKRKLRSLTVGVVLVLVAMTTWWWLRNPLDEFVGRDLRTLDDNSPIQAWAKKTFGRWVPDEVLSSHARLRKLLDRILPDEYVSEPKRKRFVFFEPLYLWRYEEESQGRFMLLEVGHGMGHGSGQAAVLDAHAKHLGSSLVRVGGFSDIVN